MENIENYFHISYCTLFSSGCKKDELFYSLNFLDIDPHIHEVILRKLDNIASDEEEI